jgi:hypothetical protein
MSAVGTKWNKSLVVFALCLGLVAALQIARSQPSPAAAPAQTAPLSPHSGEEPPASNEIAEFPQLG